MREASVTTTWGVWRELHPDTRVLPLDTRSKRDYSEGAAYREYFSTDRIMFQVSQADKRLKNNAEVLAMQLEHTGTKQPVAIAIDFLKGNLAYANGAF